MRLFNKRNKQFGIGLLELMLSLAIISILIVMATRYFGTVTLSQKINATHMQIIDIIQGLHQWRTKYGNYNNLTDIKQLTGVVSPEIIENKTPFGGAEVAWVVVPQANGTVTIQLKTITKEQCQTLVNTLGPRFAPPIILTCNNGQTGLSDLLIIWVR